ncbi:MAG: hypothetical protein EGR12_08615 [Coprococcus catus]|nr:hypothetical protein [Coprococcus catus]
MKNLKIPVGISDFSEIRENGYYYIDKSGLIAELLRNEATKVTLITRPRRFGKTLAMSMLADFFDVRRESRGYFSGLEIEQHKGLCKDWMNQYPVLFLSLKDVDGTNFNNAFELLKFVLAQCCENHDYLLESNKISEQHKNLFNSVRNRTASVTDVQGFILVLTNMMQVFYNKSVILLLDEYDVPLAKASSNGYYKEMLEIIKVMMSTALKDNPAIKFAIVTGCLRIAKESIFTGTNNFVSDTITSSGLNEFFGFTQKEVNGMLADVDAEGKADEVKKWYDGYHFGDYDVYCPWDMMNYLRDIQCHPTASPVGYWKNTSDNAIIRSFIDYAGSNITEKIETLLSGGYIIQHINENLTYDYLHSSEENLWSILYLTGYLTRAREEAVKKELPEDLTALMIPNKEIREIFETTVKKWFSDHAREWNREKLFEAVWNGDSEKLTAEMTRLLRRTISYHDYREDFYHAFLAGIFTGAGYRVESNREHGEGRSDIVIYDMPHGRVAVFEVKYSLQLQDMEKDCDRALSQIKERFYAKEFENDYDEVWCYGISFFRKRCLVKKK